MTRRSQRVGNLIRDVLGQVILTKLSDPRVDPARTSVVRVEVPEDLLTAKVYISVMGSDKEQGVTLQALRHAAGHFQELLMRQITLRHTPALDFVLDVQFKKTIKTLEILQQVAQELRAKDEAAAAGAGESPDAEAAQKKDSQDNPDEKP
ncbi:MAG: 30S ribosome-binding factor RbfA [Planctomycetaceae bacterium]|nr:30S ribosome-binding factor RbfA [Planctomycetaceae bacterium]